MLDEKKAFHKAKERALYLLEYRDYSKKELFDKLKKTNPEEYAQMAIEYLEELGLIDDERFAKKYVHDLVHFKRFFGQRLKYELQRKGIEPVIIEEVLDDLDVDPSAQITQIINRKYPRALSNEKDRRRAINACRRMGYSWDDIKNTLNYMDEGYDEI